MNSLPLEVTLAIADMTADKLLAGVTPCEFDSPYYRKGCKYGTQMAADHMKLYVTRLFRDKKLVKRRDIADHCYKLVDIAMTHIPIMPLTWRIHTHWLCFTGRMSRAADMTMGFNDTYLKTLQTIVAEYEKDEV